LLAVLAVALLGAAVWLGLDTLRSDSGGNGGGGNAAASGGTQVALEGIGAYDPEGDDGVENNEDAPLATDGDESTHWRTVRYYDAPAIADKSGVGLVLDASRSVSLAEVRVTSDTPGFSARIQGGQSPTGPFTDLSGSRTVQARTTFELEGDDARYYVVWITTVPPGGSAHVNEVRATE
jgi:hypothetical protein